MSYKLFYHGTSLEKSGQAILAEGIRPDLSATQGLARPVEGRIYLTTNLRYALIYLLGGDMLGHELPRDWIEKSRYGYLFAINESSLQDIQPDEDQVGQALCEEHVAGLKKYRELLEEEAPLSEDGEEAFAHNLLEQVQAGEYAAWIKAGHLILPLLSQEEKMSIIAHYQNVAHLGALRPVKAWRFDKLKSSLLEDNGANFFDLAEEVL